MLTTAKPSDLAIPFDTGALDRLMDEAGIDVLLATRRRRLWIDPSVKHLLVMTLDEERATCGPRMELTFLKQSSRDARFVASRPGA